MRRTHIVLLAWMQLCGARYPGFSIHEDILTYPQFEVVFSEDYILQEAALQLLDSSNHPRPSTDGADSTSSQTDLAHPAAASTSLSSSSTSSFSSSTDETPPYADDTADDGSAQVSETFELVNLPASRYLCSVPVLAPPPAPNQTATDIARAAEARELSRAEDRGVAIISALEGECLYYAQGWWSYSFCYGKEIVQFHALAIKMGKPVRDPRSDEYVLGRMEGKQARERRGKEAAADRATAATAAGAAAVHAAPATANTKIKTPETHGDVDVHQKPLGGGGSSSGTKKEYDAYGTELQVKGDQKYMVQHLADGTVCDLTGRERTIEVQYHCNPGATVDRINSLREVTTCAYLMEVLTPRLCQEPAFLPPKPARAHPIICRQIISSDEELVQWHQQKTIEAHVLMRGAAKKAKNEEPQERGGEGETGQQQQQQQRQEPKQNGIVVGGVTIGARKALGRGEDGQPPLTLERPKGFMAAAGGRGPGAAADGTGTVVQVLARARSAEDGGEIEILEDAELDKLDIEPEAVEELVLKVNKIAGGNAWRLEAVDNPGEPHLEIRAVLENGDEEEKREKATTEKAADDEEPAEAEAGGQQANERQTHTDEAAAEAVTVTVKRAEAAADSKDDEGSQEAFKKDEL